MPEEGFLPQPQIILEPRSVPQVKNFHCEFLNLPQRKTDDQKRGIVPYPPPHLSEKEWRNVRAQMENFNALFGKLKENVQNNTLINLFT